MIYVAIPGLANSQVRTRRGDLALHAVSDRPGRDGTQELEAVRSRIIDGGAKRVYPRTPREHLALWGEGGFGVARDYENVGPEGISKLLIEKRRSREGYEPEQLLSRRPSMQVRKALKAFFITPCIFNQIQRRDDLSAEAALRWVGHDGELEPAKVPEILRRIDEGLRKTVSSKNLTLYRPTAPKWDDPDLSVGDVLRDSAHLLATRRRETARRYKNVESRDAESAKGGSAAWFGRQLVRIRAPKGTPMMERRSLKGQHVPLLQFDLFVLPRGLPLRVEEIQDEPERMVTVRPVQETT